MKKSRILVLFLALAAAAGAFILSSGRGAPPPQVVVAPAPAPATDDVLVAAKDLPMGTVVGDTEVSWQPWPKDAVAPGMIRKSETPAVVDDLRGSIARTGVFLGEPIRREKFVKGTDPGLMAAILPSGRRAVAINIDSQGSTTAGGFIQPQDHVDVIRTYREEQKAGAAGAGGDNYVSETLLQNIKVLAIGPNVEEKNGQPVVVGSNATLELDPVQAETIVLAQRTGQLSLTLRSMLDVKQPNQAAAPQSKNVTVIRFGTASEDSNR